MSDPMKTMLLQLLFGNWLKLLNNGEYEELRTSIAKAITTLEKTSPQSGSMDVYVCGCEVPTDTGKIRHFEMRCPTCTYSGGASDNLDEDS
jgi:hypothetical protein